MCFKIHQQHDCIIEQTGPKHIRRLLIPHARCLFRKSYARRFEPHQRGKGPARSRHGRCVLCTLRPLTMPLPIARPISLPPEEHPRLAALVRAHATPQALALRCRLLLPDRGARVPRASAGGHREGLRAAYRRPLASSLSGARSYRSAGGAARGSTAALCPPPSGLRSW
jgi:hypothetical protein